MELVIHIPRGRTLEARGVIVRDRRAGDIGRRRVFRGGTGNLGLIASLGALDCIWQRGRLEIVSMADAAVVGRLRWNFHSRVRGGLARYLRRLRRARFRICKKELIITGGRTLGARWVSMRDRCAGGIDRR